MTSNSPGHVTPFSCDMSALAPGERERHLAMMKAVFGAVQEIRELADGYAFRLPNDAEMLIQVSAFVAKERLCCPFFGFRIEIESESGPLWLSLTGREGVKPFIKTEIGDALPDSVAQAFQPHASS